LLIFFPLLFQSISGGGTLIIKNATEPEHTTIAADCERCLAADGIFFKQKFTAQSALLYSCRYMSPPSNFTFVVDRACEKSECQRIEFRPVRVILQPEEMKCSTALEINLDAFPPIYTTNTSVHFTIKEDCNKDNTPTLHDFGVGTLFLLFLLQLCCLAIAVHFMVLAHTCNLIKKRKKAGGQEMNPLTGRR